MGGQRLGSSGPYRSTSGKDALQCRTYALNGPECMLRRIQRYRSQIAAVGLPGRFEPSTALFE